MVATEAEGTHHRPPHDAVFHHQIACHRRRNLGHMIPVVFFAHAWLPVATDGQAKELAF